MTEFTVNSFWTAKPATNGNGNHRSESPLPKTKRTAKCSFLGI